MVIADLLGPGAVLGAVHASGKPALLKLLAERAADSLGLDAAAIAAALDAREQLGSTGVGQGIAMPHARIAGLTKPFGLLARLERPIDFAAIDEKPVDLVFLLLTPPAETGVHLGALACASRRLREKNVARRLRGARDGAELYAVLTDEDPRPPQ